MGTTACQFLAASVAVPNTTTLDGVIDATTSARERLDIATTATAYRTTLADLAGTPSHLSPVVSYDAHPIGTHMINGVYIARKTQNNKSTQNKHTTTQKQTAGGRRWSAANARHSESQVRSEATLASQEMFEDMEEVRMWPPVREVKTSD